MKIVSWNINSLRARLDLLKLYIQNTQPAILLLQETKVTDEDFPVHFFHALSYDVIYWGQKSYNGVAIASLRPFEHVICKDFTGHQEARYLEATTHSLRIGCVYVPNGQNRESTHFEKKISFLKALRAHLQKVPWDSFFILGGDFNVALADEDVYDPLAYHDQLLCSVPERKALRSLLYDGWYDSFLTQPFQKNPLSWWPYQGGAFEKNAGLRLDYFFLSPAAIDRMNNAGIDRTWRQKDFLCTLPLPSDHAPIWLDIKDADL